MKNKQIFKLQKRTYPEFTEGFTLIEVLLYMAIVTIIMSAFVLFAWNAIILGAKNNTQQELYTQGRIVSERILSEIRNANDINISTSNFDVDLTTNSAYQLSLNADTPNNPTIFSVSSGILMIKLGAVTAVPLHSDTVQITSLIFSNYSSGDGKTKNIKYVLTFRSNSTSTSQQYKGTITLESSAEIRSNPL